MDDDLGIGLGPESVAFAEQIFSQFLVVIDLPVEDDPDGVVLVCDGLLAPCSSQ